MTTIDNSHVIAVEEEEEGTRRASTAGADVSPRRRGAEIEAEKRRGSSVSECSVEMDLECGLAEIKVHLAKIERDCRICHLSLDSSNHESGIPIELGCSCKDDLAAAHKHCAEAWFKIKGDM